jgi:hypothetical protein
MGINQGPISLDQKYTQSTGHVFLTGIQALVRLPMRKSAGIAPPASIPRALSVVTAGRRSAVTTSSCSPRESISSNTTSNSSPG